MRHITRTNGTLHFPKMCHIKALSKLNNFNSQKEISSFFFGRQKFRKHFCLYEFSVPWINVNPQQVAENTFRAPVLTLPTKELHLLLMLCSHQGSFISQTMAP